MSSALDTPARLVSAAETLFAAHGIDAVPLREISRASGARNAVAIQYHFKDREGVLAAIVEKHVPGIEGVRHALLDSFWAVSSSDSLRFLAGALVRPLAAKLSDPDGGPEFLQIYGQLFERPPTAGVAGETSLNRWREMVDPYLERDAVRLHRRYTAILHSATELSRRARSGPHKDDRLFTSYLTDVVAAILSFPVSSETSTLADERDRALSSGRRRKPA
jgi:AcrR family transcriptional regulator